MGAAADDFGVGSGRIGLKQVFADIFWQRQWKKWANGQEPGRGSAMQVWVMAAMLRGLDVGWFSYQYIERRSSQCV